jgi:hypothetical protein
MPMSAELPDGDYPFIDQRIPLADMAMIEVPAEMESLLRASADKQGLAIVRGSPVELTCEMPGQGQATFLIYWPYEQDRMHMLAPKEFAARRS